MRISINALDPPQLTLGHSGMCEGLSAADPILISQLNIDGREARAGVTSVDVADRATHRIITGGTLLPDKVASP